MKEFVLACGATVLLDDEDYERLPKTGWYLTGQKRKDCKSGIRKTRYATHDTYGKMHRWVLGITDPKIIIDHIDKNGLNNQKSNLRIVTTAENKRNQTTLSNNIFHFNGISYEKGVHPRLRVHWSEDILNYSNEKRKTKFGTKSFSLKKYDFNYTQALKDAILFRIEKMKANGYLLDERSTTIEKILRERENPDIEKLLGIKFDEVFE